MRRAIITTLFVLCVVFLATPVMASRENGETTLEFMESLDIRIDNTGGGTLRIVADFQVDDGVPVNVFFTNKQGYDDFKDPMKWEFSYYEAYSQNNTDDYHKEFTWSESGDFYFIVTNSGYSSMDISEVSYDVEWSTGGFLGFPWWCWVIAIVIIIIALGLGWIFRRGGRGGGSEAAPTGVPPSEPTPPPETTYPPLGEGETSPMATTVLPEGMAGTPEGATELGPQPEPPDAESPAVVATPEGLFELSPQPEPPGAESPAVMATTEGHTELGPQPEPPDAESPAVMTTPEGHVELGPQPEPPDSQVRIGGSGTDGVMEEPAEPPARRGPPGPPPEE